MFKRLLSRKKSEFKVINKEAMKSSACCCYGDGLDWDFGL